MVRPVDVLEHDQQRRRLCREPPKQVEQQFVEPSGTAGAGRLGAGPRPARRGPRRKVRPDTPPSTRPAGPVAPPPRRVGQLLAAELDALAVQDEEAAVAGGPSISPTSRVLPIPASPHTSASDGRPSTASSSACVGRAGGFAADDGPARDARTQRRDYLQRRGAGASWVGCQVASPRAARVRLSSIATTAGPS